MVISIAEGRYLCWMLNIDGRSFLFLFFILGLFNKCHMFYDLKWQFSNINFTQNIKHDCFFSLIICHISISLHRLVPIYALVPFQILSKLYWFINLKNLQIRCFQLDVRNIDLINFIRIINEILRIPTRLWQ